MLLAVSGIISCGCGLIFREGDVDDLSSKPKLLINNIEMVGELSRKGRQRVLNHFIQEKVANETYKIYREMMR